MYREVVGREPGELANLRRINRGKRIPVVLSAGEVRQVLRQMSGVPKLMAELLYGAGLRIIECATLRVKDIDFDQGLLPCVRAKATRTVSLFCLGGPRNPCVGSYCGSSRSTKMTFAKGRGMPQCRMRFTSRTHQRHGHSVGNLYSHLPCFDAGRLAD